MVKYLTTVHSFLSEQDSDRCDHKVLRNHHSQYWLSGNVFSFILMYALVSCWLRFVCFASCFWVTSDVFYAIINSVS